MRNKAKQQETKGHVRTQHTNIYLQDHQHLVTAVPAITQRNTAAYQ